MCFVFPSSSGRQSAGFAAAALSVFAAGLAFCLSAAPSAAEPRLSAAWPDHIAARYRIDFNGFTIGSFSYTSIIARPDSSTGKPSYRLDGQAQLSALLGAFTWQGLSQASGQVAGDKPAPGAYNFEYSSSAKSGSVRMGFRAGSVATVASMPPAPPADDVVPLERRHLAEVLDPLSAVMSLTASGFENPCNQRLPVFDGKQRFDLVFSPKGQRRIADRRPTGQPGVAHVCSVRYVPIAGYRRGSDAEQAAARMEIEMTLRPIPSANLLVPQTVTIPAVVGTVELSLERVDIRTPDRAEIALVN